MVCVDVLQTDDVAPLLVHVLHCFRPLSGNMFHQFQEKLKDLHCENKFDITTGNHMSCKPKIELNCDIWGI